MSIVVSLHRVSHDDQEAAVGMVAVATDRRGRRSIAIANVDLLVIQCQDTATERPSKTDIGTAKKRRSKIVVKAKLTP